MRLLGDGKQSQTGASFFCFTAFELNRKIKFLQVAVNTRLSS